MNVVRKLFFAYFRNRLSAEKALPQHRMRPWNEKSVYEIIKETFMRKTYLMSSAVYWFGRVEFWILNICCCFLLAGAVEKIKTNIPISTRPNQWATEDINEPQMYWEISSHICGLLRINELLSWFLYVTKYLTIR